MRLVHDISLKSVNRARDIVDHGEATGWALALARTSLELVTASTTMASLPFPEILLEVLFTVGCLRHQVKALAAAQKFVPERVDLVWRALGHDEHFDADLSHPDASAAQASDAASTADPMEALRVDVSAAILTAASLGLVVSMANFWKSLGRSYLKRVVAGAQGNTLKIQIGSKKFVKEYGARGLSARVDRV